MFRHADKNEDKVLNLKEVKALLKMMNMDVDMETAKEVIKVKRRYLYKCLAYSIFNNNYY